MDSCMVEVIIITYNANKWIHKCLESVYRTTYPSFTVSVIDNNSIDDTVSIIRSHFPSVNLIVNSRNLGYAGAINYGIRAALNRGSEFFAVLNQDIIVSPDWLSSLMSVFKEYPDYGALFP